MFINIHDIAKKLNIFQNYIFQDPQMSYIRETETWLCNEIYDHEILPSNYSLIHKDHGSHGGGVMLAICNS